MSLSGIFTLSVEILVEVLSYLHHLDLLHCRQISHKFSTLVNETPSLRYTLELGLTGYEDGSSSSSLLQRLDTLHRIQRAWLDPHPTFSHSVTVPSQEWFEARWFKDTLVGRIPMDTRRLDIFRLSKTVPDEERLKSLRFDVDFDAACVDPGKDLVVLTRSASGPNNGGLRPPPRIYLRALSTQKPHPRARENFFDLAGYGFSWAPFARRLKVQVSGDYLSISIYKQLVVEALLVWHWPSGTINAILRPPSDVYYLSAFCTPSGYLLVNRHRRRPPAWFGIYVYALDPTEETPRLLASFALPSLHWDPSSLLSASFYPNYTRHGTPGGALGAPADCAPGCALVQLRMDLQYTLYTPLATFVAPAVVADRHRVEPLAFEWAAWGPRAARIVEEGSEAPVVCGFRAVYSDYILDFCPHRVAADALLDGSDAKTQRDTQTRCYGELHTESSTLQATMFSEPVMTSLPYRKTKLQFPCSASRLTSDVVQVVLEDVDGPKIIRAACKDFVLVPTSADIYSI